MTDKETSKTDLERVTELEFLLGMEQAKSNYCIEKIALHKKVLIALLKDLRTTFCRPVLEDDGETLTIELNLDRYLFTQLIDELTQNDEKKSDE
jgi:hypothetical protein